MNETGKTQVPAFDAIAKVVVAEVLKRLGQGDSHDVLGPHSQPNAVSVLWVMAAPARHLESFVGLWTRFHRLGYQQRFVLCGEVSSLLEGALSFVGSDEVLVLEEEGGRNKQAMTALGWAAESALVYVGSLGLKQAKSIADLDDSNIFSKILLESLLSDVPVHLFRGEKMGGVQRIERGGSAGVRNGSLLRRVAAVWRNLESSGVLGLSIEEGLRPVTSIEAGKSTLGKTLGGLVTEKDVEEALANGLKTLTLAQGTVVTPLARDRARELEVELS